MYPRYLILYSLNKALSNECYWTSDICPHHVYNFTNITEKSKIEGRQSRFLGLIIGMDPISMLRASGQIAKPFDNGPHYDHIQYWGGEDEFHDFAEKIKKTTWQENEKHEVRSGNGYGKRRRRRDR